MYTHPIGSLPRPQAVRDLLGRRDELGEDRFTGMLDDMVRFAVHVQELAGLDVVSDGEWRRVQYIREFLLRIGGFERCRRYHHLGEENFCDPDLVAGQTHDERLRRHWDIDEELPLAMAAIHRVVEGLRCEVHLHCCHSVYKRRSDVRGDYKPLLPRFKDLRVDRVNLEFAYPGTGDISDLALLPPHLDVGIGVVDVRSAVLQTVEQIAELVTAALKVLPPDRVALNPDCGFAPDGGEPPTLDEAYEKLQRLVRAARIVRENLNLDTVRNGG